VNGSSFISTERVKLFAQSDEQGSTPPSTDMFMHKRVQMNQLDHDPANPAAPGLLSIDRELAELPKQRTNESAFAIAELRASWVKLVGLLMMKSEPERHGCPVCNRAVSAAATLCGECWTKRGPPRR
jgi:hypothetical protein